MVKWSGDGELHLTNLPRKPTSQGFLFDTMCCGECRILLKAEINEGKERMAQKEYRDQVGASTASTLRLTKDYAGSQRTVVADARFGSCQTLEWLWDEHYLHSLLAVKTAHTGFPR